jgi:hypothetical protein
MPEITECRGAPYRSCCTAGEPMARAQKKWHARQLSWHVELTAVLILSPPTFLYYEEEIYIYIYI